jgi:hypothetical protein
MKFSDENLKPKLTRYTEIERTLKERKKPKIMK